MLIVFVEELFKIEMIMLLLISIHLVSNKEDF